jgi:hypothetical protein
MIQSYHKLLWARGEDPSGKISDGRRYFPAAPEHDADVLEVLIGKMGRTEKVDAVLR